MDHKAKLDPAQTQALREWANKALELATRKAALELAVASSGKSSISFILDRAQVFEHYLKGVDHG